MPDETSPLLRSDAAENNSNYTGNGGDVETEVSVTPQADIPSVGKSHLAFVIPMMFGIFIGAMDQTIVVASYAAIGSELNQLQNTSWIATAYMLTLTSFQPLYGKLSDIFGRKGCLLFAYSIFTLGSLLCGLSRNMTELIASRALTGIGGAGMSTIIMSDVVPLRSRGTWQGVLNIIFATGAATGAPLGGFITDSIGWRWAFLIQVPIALLAIISVSISLHLPKTDPSNFSAKLKRIDFGGGAALVLTVFSLLFGLDRGGNISWRDPITISSLCAFAAFLFLFILIEGKLASEPFAPKRIILNKTLIAAYLVNFFGIAASMNQLFHVSLYLQAVQGKTASIAGLWLVPSVIGGLFGSLSGGLTIQATGKYYIITVVGYGLLVLGSGLIYLTTGALVHSATGVGIGLVIMSIGNGSGITTSLIALISNAGQADQAIATAVSYLFRSLGSVVGVSVGSTLVQETLRNYLWSHLSGQDVEEIIRRVRESLSYIDELDPDTRLTVTSAYTQAVQSTLSFSLILAVCGFVSSLFIHEKVLIRK